MAEFVTLAMPSPLRIPPGIAFGDAVYARISSGFVVETDPDGVRCQALSHCGGWSFCGPKPINAGQAEYMSLQARCSGIMNALSTLFPVGTLIDCKLIHKNEGEALIRQALRTTSNRHLDVLDVASCTLTICDIVRFGGDETARWPLSDRRRLLSDLVYGNEWLNVMESYRGGSALEFAFGTLLAGKGIVLRRDDAPYRFGRTKEWLRYKGSPVATMT